MKRSIFRSSGRTVSPLWCARIALGCCLLNWIQASDTNSAVEVLLPETVSRWAEVMASHHPSLKAAQARAQAAQRNADGVRRVADPRFMIGGALYSAKGMNPSEEGNLIYGVEQPLPLLGKETAARALARAEADTEAVRADARFQELRRDLAISLFQAAFARRAVELAEADQAWLKETVRTMESRLGAGAGSSVEVLRAQTEQARRQVEVATLRAQEGEARATVNRRLGRDPLAPLPGFDLPALAEPVEYNERLVRLALEAEPRRRVLASERDAAGALVEATRRSQRPNLSVGVDGRQYGGDGEFREGTFFLSVSLPLWNRGKFRQDLARDRDRLRAAEEEHADSALQVREEIHHLALRLATARQEALLYQDEVLPRAESALRAAQAQWSAGQGSLREVLDAQRMVLEARLQFARAVGEQWSTLSELVLCCGLGDLEALEMVRPAPGRSLTPIPPQP